MAAEKLPEAQAVHAATTVDASDAAARNVAASQSTQVGEAVDVPAAEVRVPPRHVTCAVQVLVAVVEAAMALKVPLAQSVQVVSLSVSPAVAVYLPAAHTA